jgi:hypothetical protein
LSKRTNGGLFLSAPAQVPDLQTRAGSDDGIALALPCKGVRSSQMTGASAEILRVTMACRPHAVHRSGSIYKRGVAKKSQFADQYNQAHSPEGKTRKKQRAGCGF